LIKISKRLETLSSYVPEESKVIDIGCDHGLLDIYLALNRKKIDLIASDINEKALNQARTNVKKYNLEEKIDLRLGSGLDVVNENEIDTIVISGIGSYKIVGIIYNNLKKIKNVKRIITGTQSNDEFLRKKLTKVGYYIKDELLLEENNITYTIIIFDKGKKHYNKKELFFGPILLKKNDELFKRKNKEDLKKLKILDGIIPKSHFSHRVKNKRKIKMYKKIYK